MERLEVDTVLGWRGRTVRDRQGEKLGKLGLLYLDADDRPAYAGVSTGLFGTRESIVPLDGVREDGGDLHVPFDGDLVRDAPNMDPEAVLSPEEEDALARHYGTQVKRDFGGTEEGTMIRSEETATIEQGPLQPTERVRLRKVMVTENVEQTVPLRREIIQLETDPPPEGIIESTEELDGRPDDVGERRLDEGRPLDDGERPLDPGAPPERR
jgi:hypothetical protein